MFNGKINYTWPCSIANCLLVYQRVACSENPITGTKKWIPWPAGADCTGKTSALEGGACRMLRGLRVGMRESSQRKFSHFCEN